MFFWQLRSWGPPVSNRAALGPRAAAGVGTCGPPPVPRSADRSTGLRRPAGYRPGGTFPESSAHRGVRFSFRGFQPGVGWGSGFGNTAALYGGARPGHYPSIHRQWRTRRCLCGRHPREGCHVAIFDGILYCMTLEHGVTFYLHRYRCGCK